MAEFGYRGLIIACGLSVAVFAFVPPGAPGPLLWILLFLAGAVWSVQFTTLNILAYADIEATEREHDPDAGEAVRAPADETRVSRKFQDLGQRAETL